jgi:predicted nucleic acid-binding protein
MIAAAVALNGSARLWSQDMQHGMRIGGAYGENPFRAV